jgi:hypothetical protein
MSKQDELAKIMIEFIRNTIMGHESGFYKMLNGAPNMLMSDSMHTMIDLAAANYLNAAYRALIKDDDEYFMKYFNDMSAVMNHSQICLLNVTFVFLTSVHKMMNRKRFDIGSYGKYMESVSSDVDRVIGEMKGKLVNSISHECNGEDIKTCDPNQDLFIVKNN